MRVALFCLFALFAVASALERPNQGHQGKTRCNGKDGRECATGLLGECATGRTRCFQDVAVCEPRQEATDEVCDEKDNDCDGITDNVGPACSVNSCTGVASCVNGVFVCALNAPATDTTCNGIDDDCDGETDDDWVAASPTCLVNSCSGTQQCVAGSVVCSIPGRTVNDTSCNGVDNDCDGSVDEDFVSTSCSKYSCAGNTVCSAGSVSCNPISSSIDNTCNNIDEDCDGATDDGWVSGGACTVNGCAGTYTSCSHGTRVCTPTSPTAEVCNGVDDNCDGQTDNGLENCLTVGDFLAGDFFAKFYIPNFETFAGVGQQNTWVHIYTHPSAPGDTWYHSRLYMYPCDLTDNNTRTEYTLLRAPTTTVAEIISHSFTAAESYPTGFSSVSGTEHIQVIPNRVSCIPRDNAESDIVKNGWNANERILLIAISTASNAGPRDVDFVLHSAGFKFRNGTQYEATFGFDSNSGDSLFWINGQEANSGAVFPDEAEPNDPGVLFKNANNETFHDGWHFAKHTGDVATKKINWYWYSSA